MLRAGVGTNRAGATRYRTNSQDVIEQLQVRVVLDLGTKSWCVTQATPSFPNRPPQRHLAVNGWSLDVKVLNETRMSLADQLEIYSTTGTNQADSARLLPLVY